LGQELPKSARRHNQAQQAAKHRSPTRRCSISFSVLSLTCGNHASASLFFLPLHFSPQHCIAPRRIPPRRTSVRVTGRSGRRLARTSSQGAPVCSPRGLPRRKRPLYPSSATPKVVAPSTAAPPCRSFRRSNQPERASCPCPCPLDRTLQPSGPSPLASQAALGFSPFLVRHCRKRKRGEEDGSEWGRGGGAEHRVAVDAPGTVRGSHAPSRGRRSRAETSLP
jgi:hypothetical protein